MIPYIPGSDDGELIISVGEPSLITYEKFVTNLVKERGAEAQNLEHMVIGICGEAGELADAIKKYTIYEKPLDVVNVLEELGDLEFYIAGLRQMLAINRTRVLKGNVEKLRKRYKSGSYSDEAAQARADKLPEAVDSPAGCHIIDVTSAEYIAANPPISKEQVAAVDETSDMAVKLADPEVPPDIQPWCVPLLEQFHPNKTVQAIAYTSNTATVLFVGDSNPYKLYKPKV